jgi:hypothetical protein
MSAKNLSGVVAGIVVVLLIAHAGWADVVTVNVSTEVWIRQSDPNKTYENDRILVASDPDFDGGMSRSGALEFDLRSISQEITGASLNLYNYSWEGNDRAAAQTAFSMPLHNALGSLTWNNLGNYTAGGTAFESLGAVTLPSGHAMGQYYSSSASAADVAAIEGLRMASDPNERKLTVLLSATSGAVSWGDAANGDLVAQLVVTTIPEPNTLIMIALSLLGLLIYVWRRR